MASQMFAVFAIAGLFSVPIVGAQDLAVKDQVNVAESAGVAEISAGRLSVTYDSGQLTIKAHNVPLLEVLRRVCSEIGAEIDAPLGASEPIYVELGPGPARAVLSSLLTGSTFNYVLQASEQDPNALASLMLTPMSVDHTTQNRETVLDAHVSSSSVLGKEATGNNESIVADESVNPKESVAQMKDLIAQAKGEIAGLEAEADPSLQAGAVQLIGMLEKSMDSLVDQAAQTSEQPPPAALPDNNSGNRRHHRRR